MVAGNDEIEFEEFRGWWLLQSTKEGNNAMKVFDERRDVAIMFHSRGCEPCANLAVYYKRVAQRFQELGLLHHRPTLHRPGWHLCTVFRADHHQPVFHGQSFLLQGRVR